jgi:hypothetical protein
LDWVGLGALRGRLRWTGLHWIGLDWTGPGLVCLL